MTLIHPPSNTRARIIALLRRASQTVDELAASLGLTDNAVRAQLTRLERDGLVRQRGARKGVRKPAFEYDLVPEADSALSKAYVPLLEAVIGTLADRVSPAELDALLREAGRRAAQTLPKERGDTAQRVAAASRALDSLGGQTTVTGGDAHWTIRSDGCPVASLVRQHPATCAAVESLVAELVGLSVWEVCDRSGDRPRCRFEIGNGERRSATGPLDAPS